MYRYSARCHQNLASFYIGHPLQYFNKYFLGSHFYSLLESRTRNVRPHLFSRGYVGSEGRFTRVSDPRGGGVCRTASV